MSQPTPYNRQFNFRNQQAQTPTDPLPAAEVDKELNAVKVTLDQTLVNLAKVQRDDGALKNRIVTQDSLSDSLSIGFTYHGSWESGRNYLLSDGVSVGSTFYKALSSHLSSGANQPPNATFWDPIADFTPLAIGVDSVGTVALQNGAVTEDKLGASAVTTGKLANSAVTEPKLADGAATNAKLGDMAANTIKGSVAGGVPEDLTSVQVRSVTGQVGTKVYDVLVSGAAVTGFDIPLAGFSHFDIRLIVIPNTAVADFQLYWRVSFNNGASYDSGASDYSGGALTQAASTVFGGAIAPTSHGLFSGTIDTANTFIIGAHRAEFYKGAAGVCPFMVARASTYDGTNLGQQFLPSYRYLGSIATHLRIVTNTAVAGIGIGSRIIVEGC